MKDVLLWTGAGQIGMAIARRVGFDKKIIVGDKNIENAKTVAKIMTEAGFDMPCYLGLGYPADDKVVVEQNMYQAEDKIHINKW